MLNGRNILSVVLGCLGAVAVFFILLLFSIALGLFGWADGGDPEDLRRLDQTTIISLYASIFFGAVVGSYITHKISQTRYIHFITAVVLFVSLFVLNGTGLRDLWQYLSAIIGCVAGGMLPLNKKRSLS